MKKSGNVLSFFLLGLIAQFSFMALYWAFFNYDDLMWGNLASSVLVASSFLVIRFFSDWKLFDNFFEDGMRRIIISESYTPRAIFYFFGAGIIAIFNFNLLAINPVRIFLLALLSIAFAHNLHELGRVKINGQKTQKEKMITYHKSLRLTEKEVNSYGEI